MMHTRRGPYNMEIVDRVVIPEDLPPGKWVLNWRMDQEESNQIWQSCAGVLHLTRVCPWATNPY